MSKENKKIISQPVTASGYRKNIAEAVELPSGNTFLLRKVPLQTYIRNGRLPEQLFKNLGENWEELQKLSEDQAGLRIVKDLDDAEIQKLLIFQAEVVEKACVSPRIVVDGTKDDELDPNELTEIDFVFIFKWAITRGGEEALSLENFRSK